MAKFNIGDRVKCVSFHIGHPVIGKEGVVVGYGQYLEVKMDDDRYNHYQRNDESPWVRLFEPDELEIVHDKKVVYHNRYSDTIADIMENVNIGDWLSELEERTPVFIFHKMVSLFNDPTINEKKEIAFTLLWLMNDEEMDEMLEIMEGM